MTKIHLDLTDPQCLTQARLVVGGLASDICRDLRELEGLGHPLGADAQMGAHFRMLRDGATSLDAEDLAALLQGVTFVRSVVCIQLRVARLSATRETLTNTQG